MLLDLVEVAQLHSGINFAAAFVKILDNFGISEKVSYFLPLGTTSQDSPVET
jgi:hypothetical protein